MNEDRRDFLKKSGTCALGMVAMATQMQFLGRMSAMAQRVFDEQKNSDILSPNADYKALVLLFYQGGNDGNNMIIPNHSDGTISNYTAYSNARNSQGLAVPQANLLPISVPRLGGLTYGLHPNLGPPAGNLPTPLALNGTTIVNNGIYDLWGAGKLAAVVNVGTLVQPLMKSQYSNSAYKKPFQLFSHSDQVGQYQTSISSTQSFTGWGGRVADKMNATNNPGGLVPMITSINGAQLFTAGQNTLPLAIADSNTALANVLNLSMSGTGTAARLTAYNDLRTQDLSSHYIAAASHVTDLAMAADAAFNTAGDTTVTFPNTSLGRQLRQVARIIKDSPALNVTRQIFYVQVGSFDTHSNQISGQGGLLTTVGQALRSFWDELGAQGMQNSVTTFTMSDFNRTFNPAGSGSGVGTDHAWGNHMLVLGGSVIGGDFYGSLRPDGSGNYFPTLTLGGPDDVDTGSTPRGRWLPTTSVEQYAAQLARWYGLSQDPATLAAVFPNLTNFPGTYAQLGFLP